MLFTVLKNAVQNSTLFNDGKEESQLDATTMVY